MEKPEIEGLRRALEGKPPRAASWRSFGRLLWIAPPAPAFAGITGGARSGLVAGGGDGFGGDFSKARSPGLADDRLTRRRHGGARRSAHLLRHRNGLLNQAGGGSHVVGSERLQGLADIVHRRV